MSLRIFFLANVFLMYAFYVLFQFFGQKLLFKTKITIGIGKYLFTTHLFKVRTNYKFNSFSTSLQVNNFYIYSHLICN